MALLTSVSGGQLKYGDQFFFVTARYKKKKYAHAKMAVGGKFLGATSATSASWKPCPNKVLIAGQNLKLLRLAYHRLFNMSKLSMVLHLLTQMPCDFVDKLKAKGRKLF